MRLQTQNEEATQAARRSQGGSRHRMVASAIALALFVIACGGPASTTTGTDALVDFDGAAFTERLAGSERPTVVNVWGSWCLPCRSEAPLLEEAFEQYSDRVDFVGVAINDTQEAAAQFIDEFGIQYENLFDRNAAIRAQFGGIGAPITYFIAPGGELVETHLGIIDGSQLAVNIDELLTLAS